MIIALDGPAGSGKSTIARGLAARLGFLYLDTGAMYRAVALRFLELETDEKDQRADEIVASLELGIEYRTGEIAVFLGSRDVTCMIRTREVAVMSSRVSTLPTVRSKMVDEQRRIASREVDAGHGIVVEGRDIGTVVFPDADLKFYFDADPKERARRRINELKISGQSPDAAEVLREIKERDERDLSRSISPLRKADDAIVIDTTSISIEMLLDEIETIVRERIK